MSESPRHLVSLGFFSERTQADYGLLLKELQRRGIGPAFIINTVPHYDAEQVERVMCDLENAGRVPARPLIMRVPAHRVTVVETAAGSSGKEPPCNST